MAILRANNNTLSSVTALPAAIPTGSMVKLFSLTSNTSGVSEYDIDSTYINSTYDNYLIFYNATSATSSARKLRIRFFESGTINDSADYWYMSHPHNGSTAYQSQAGASYIEASRNTNVHYGNGFGTSGNIYLCNVNQTNSPTFVIGQMWYAAAASGSQVGVNYSGGFDDGKNTATINGIRFFQDTDNIIMREFSIYGITK